RRRSSCLPPKERHPQPHGGDGTAPESSRCPERRYRAGTTRWHRLRRIFFAQSPQDLRARQTTLSELKRSWYRLRSVYHRYPRQDEFGPGRVEQLIALRELARFADRAIDLLNTVTSQLREHLSVELDRIERFSRRIWFDVTEIHAFALAVDRLVRKSERYQLSQSHVDLLHRLTSTLTELINRIPRNLFLDCTSF
ncbi:MAG TPA: hypothetical protein VJT13_22490, partial [Xanthobacteraceae bacterium]|nr:hypothetical protein [Xanthobacteraceae bacterium]